MTIRIPKAEQTKFPTFTDIRIVLSFYYTNAEYKDIDTFEH